MNFLSHYYLHADKNDNYFTVGLTLPDLLGFHSRRIRLTKKILKKSGESEQNENIRSCIAGMIAHLSLDSWFHRSHFFKEKVHSLQNKYINFNKDHHRLPLFYAHIIIEIFIDRYLLMIEPDIADRFYESYKIFNFDEISRIFTELKNFDTDKFLSLANDVSYSSFLKEYTDDHKIISILQRVSKRIDLPLFLDVNDDDFAEFIKVSYENLEGSIKEFVSHTKKDIKINKKMIFDSNFSFSL